jgi:hypothetical protein
MLEFVSLIYFWNLKVTAIVTLLAFLFTFYRYRSIEDSSWLAKVLIALILGWAFSFVVFLGRVCWEILENVGLPTLANLKDVIQELDEIQ